MTVTKIATCCYCGTRAALRLRRDDRLELRCTTCGAPLHALKQFPVVSEHKQKPEPVKRRIATHTPKKKKNQKKTRRPFQYRMFKALKHDFLEELWDIAEDIFD